MADNDLASSHHRITSLAALPVELLTLVLDLASRKRRSALLELMVVCKSLPGPAILLLHRHVVFHSAAAAEGFIESIKRAPSPGRLASFTKCLSISHAGPDSPPSPGAIPSTLALPLLFLLDNLQYLEINAGDDGLKTLRQALRNGGGGMSQLRGFTSSKVRWDKLLSMVRDSHKLRRLDVKGLYLAEPPGQVPSPIDDTQPGEIDIVAPDAPGLETGSTDHSPFRPTSLALADQDDEGGAAFTLPTLARPPSPALPPPPSLPHFPSLPLTHLTLRQLAIPDELFLSIISAVRNTLSSFALVDTHDVSRAALLVALQSVPNLEALDLSFCNFAPVVPQPPPVNSTITTLTPLPSLVLSPSLLSTPLAPSFAVHQASRTANDLSHPFDNVFRLTPFLHAFTLASDELISADGGGRGGDALAKIMALLPLQCLTLDIMRPRLGVDDVIGGLKRAEGRLEAVAIGKRYALSLLPPPGHGLDA
ncbi:hypothetical protein JCM11641_004898 [Rhodosporidiobolus odoratus]